MVDVVRRPVECARRVPGVTRGGWRVVFVASFVVLSVSSYALLGTGGATWAFVATFVSFAVFVGSAVVKLRSRKGDRQRAAVRDERDA